jgi:glutamyl-tRNA synthetase
LTDAARVALAELTQRLQQLPQWDAPSISAALKATLAAQGLKMPQLAMPLRLLVAGRLQTPSVDAVLALFGRHTVLERLAATQTRAG